MSKLLTNDKKHVQILTSIRVDKSLPKYRMMNEASGGDTDKRLNSNNINRSFFDTNNDLIKTNEALTYENLKKFLTEKVENVTDFNINVTATLNSILDRTTMNGVSFISNDPIVINKRTLWSTIVSYFKKEETKQKKFDVIKFFSEVHGLVENKEAEKYINRVAEYIECIGYTETTGQVALKEKLIKGLIINKLESVLFAKGMYKAINEDVIVELAQNAPNHLSLDYIENYVRNIPIEAIKKKIEADNLQVFDNYCILYYDENGESYAMTNKEKEREIQKLKDPIMFGLINGSNKLYFIADWVDEYCNLTFEKMTEIVGKEVIEKGFLTEKIN